MTTVSRTWPVAEDRMTPAPRPAVRAAVLSPVAAASVVACLTALAGGLRFWNMSATFESSDQASMAYLVAHSFGLEWIFAHQYGPVLPSIARAFAGAWNVCGLPFTEMTARMPMALLGTLQVLVTYPLVRRVGGGQAAGLLACGAGALLPSLVSDGHYAWGDHVPWLLAGTVSLWALLAWVQSGGSWRLVLSGAALFTHCLSSLYAMPLPMALLAVWVVAARRGGRARWWPFVLAYVLPCVAALGVIVGAYRWTGRGQLGYLLHKGSGGTIGLQWQQLGQLPGVWLSLFGWVFGAVVCVAVLWSLLPAGRPARDRGGSGFQWALLVWLLAALGPLTLAADWGTTGYPVYYFTEVAAAGSMLGALFLGRLLHGPPATARNHTGIARFAAVVLILLGGVELLAADLALIQPGIPPAACSPFHSDWGRVQPDSGAKAAGYYVRQHVPDRCAVMSLHGAGGMELPVAEFYCGRKVLAGYDCPPEAVAALCAAMLGDVDVVIVDAGALARTGAIAEAFAAGGFVRVANLRRDGDVVRAIYAREELNLIRVDWPAEEVSTRYDRRFAPRHLPRPLPAEPGFLDRLSRYQAALADLKLGGGGVR